MVATRRATAAASSDKGETMDEGAAETVVEQEDRLVEDRGLNVIPLGGEEKIVQGKTRSKSESSEPKLEIRNEDEYLVDEEEDGVSDYQDDEMIDVEGVEDEIPFALAETVEVQESIEPIVKEEEKIEVTEPPRKKSKGGRPKKEPVVNKKKKAREDHEDFMQSGSTPRGKGKKAKPDPNKPLIVDGVLVNPLHQQAVTNAYGYDPAMDIVALGKGQLKSAYRRSRAQLDTPQIDVKRYKLEVKHDHLLDDDDHDDTHRDDHEGADSFPRPTTPHGGTGEIMESINVHTGDATSATPSQEQQQQQPSPFHLQQRSASFSRRPVQPIKQAPPLIPHAPSPLSARRVSGVASTSGWGGGGGMNGGGRRRSDGERGWTSGNRSPPRKSSSHYSPPDSTPITPSTPSTPAAPHSSSLPPSSTPSSIPSSSRPTRLSQAEQFSMSAPKVIEAPKLATPIANTNQSFSDSYLDRSINGGEPLSTDVFCTQLERITVDLERANSILASISTNGN